MRPHLEKRPATKRLLWLLFGIAAAMACNDYAQPTATARVEHPDLDLIPNIARVRDVPAVEIELPDDPRPWDLSDAGLEVALDEGGRHAIMAFKAPSADRVTVDGSRTKVRQAVSTDHIHAALRAVQALGVEIVRYNSLIGGAHVIIPQGLGGQLRNHPMVDYIEPRRNTIRLGAARVIPVPGQTIEITPIGVEVVRADVNGVWTKSTGDGETIGIIDDGYDEDHPDLDDIPETHCEDHSASPGCNTAGWHGSFVAGVIAAEDDSDGVIGVAHGLRDGMYWCENEDDTAVIDCLDWLDGRVDIINMSLDMSASTALSNAVATAYDTRGRLIVSIAGNRDDADNPPSSIYPGSYSQVIAVAGVMPDSTFADGDALCTSGDSTFVEWANASNHGTYVELAAPFYTLSTAVTNGSEQPYERGFVCGTSFAAPHVSAIAALIWDENPTFDNEDVRTHLRLTAYDLTSSEDNVFSTGKDNYSGYGLVDAYSALNPPSIDTLDVSIDGPNEIPTNGGEACAYGVTTLHAEGAVSYTWKWDWSVVSTEDFYVPDEGTEGTYRLEVIATDDLFTDSDWFNVNVDDMHMCF